MLKIFLICAGILSLVAGVIGIVLPLLPTTPFLLLSAFCFARSSEKLHRWLLNHPHFGRVLSNWEKHRGMEAKHKKRALVFTTVSFAVSIYFAPIIAVKVMLTVMAVCVLTGISRLKALPVEMNQKDR